MDHVQNRLGSCLGSGLEDCLDEETAGPEPLQLWAAALKAKQRAFSSPRHLSEGHPHQILILSPLLFSSLSSHLLSIPSSFSRSSSPSLLRLAILFATSCFQTRSFDTPLFNLSANAFENAAYLALHPRIPTASQETTSFSQSNPL